MVINHGNMSQIYLKWVCKRENLIAIYGEFEKLIIGGKRMIEFKTFDDYVRNFFKLESTELTHISPEEQKKKTVAITVDELINIWNELTELKLQIEKMKCCQNCMHYRHFTKDVTECAMSFTTAQNCRHNNFDKWRQK